MRPSCSSMLSPLALALLATLTGCAVYEVPPPAPRVVVRPAPAIVYTAPAPAPQPVVSVYVEPPIAEPAPLLIGWAPPPMLVEAPPPLPYAGAVWVGGYWVWQGNWVWATGRWMAPPRADCVWVHPYYEHRDGAVVFVTGHWGAAGVAFVPPPPSLSLTLVVAAPGVIPGPRPIGPPGVFVPPPPGSRVGLIVPAPIGTPPAVVTGAAPVVNVGMRIQNNNTTVNNTRITNVTNVTNVTIVAPPSATANGRAFESSVPAQAHLAAAMPAVVHAQAPAPAMRPIAGAPDHHPAMPPQATEMPAHANAVSHSPPPAAEPPHAAAPGTPPHHGPAALPREDAHARAEEAHRAQAAAHEREKKEREEEKKAEERERAEEQAERERRERKTR